MLVVLATSAPASATVGFDLARPIHGRAMFDPRETGEDHPVDSAALARMLRRLIAGGGDGALSVLVTKVWAGQRASLQASRYAASVPTTSAAPPPRRDVDRTSGLLGARGRVHARILNLPPPSLDLQFAV